MLNDSAHFLAVDILSILPTPDDQIVNFLASFLGGGVFGGLLAAYVANKYAQSRDRRARRIEFLRLLGEWRTKVYRCPIAQRLSADFPQDVARFGGAYVALERDLWFWQRPKFHSRCDEIVAMTDAQVEEGLVSGDLIGKRTLLKRIEGLIAILD